MSKKTDGVLRLRRKLDRVIAERYENGVRALELADQAAGELVDAAKKLSLPEYQEYQRDYKRGKFL